jgi:hypothetical protein
VYGFVTDAITGDSVLANNPDLSTDAGQFAMIESVTTKDRKVEFEFIAAVPSEKDTSGEENGIGPLDFKSLRLISFPGGQQVRVPVCNVLSYYMYQGTARYFLRNNVIPGMAGPATRNTLVSLKILYS